MTIWLKTTIDNMGPKGIGPQRLGAGQAMSDCGCGMPKACDCDSPAKIAGVIASALVLSLIHISEPTRPY